MLQDMMGHSATAMTHRYLGDARKARAAQEMPVQPDLVSEGCEVPWSTLFREEGKSVHFMCARAENAQA